MKEVSTKQLPHVFERIEDWPIYELYKDRKNFVEEIDEFTFNKFKSNNSDKQIGEMIAKTIYLERIRIKEEPWKVDPPDDIPFWSKMRKKLRKSLDNSSEEREYSNDEILKKIINRYSEEIVGTFKVKTFLFARKFLAFFFSRLLNTAASRNFKRLYSRKHQLYERLKVSGEVEHVRKLMKQGSVIIVPTHFSNLDSILIGFAMDQIAGLPSFTYGAGLNLYNTGYTAYYMNRLGIYRVDRRKKNPIYLDTLKNMSKLAIERGTNCLFFPGGTRSRSGELETKLKMGLLGTTVEAQRAIYEKGKDEKVFIVPLVLGYHVVLEAQSLIEQHLKRTGKEQYLKGKDEFNSFRKILKFSWNSFSKGTDTHLNFGKPMDVLGNFVDEKGRSIDRFGNELDVKDYFLNNGKIEADSQREHEYTKILAERIVKRFHKDNLVLSSHLLAFTCFNILRKQNESLDLYALLRLPTSDYSFPMELVIQVMNQLKERLFEMESKYRIRLSEAIHLDTEATIADGLKYLGIYHPAKPLLMDEWGRLISENFQVLYYYHNRLATYNLDTAISMETIDITADIEA